MSTKKIAGTGIFLALTIASTLISNYVQFGTTSINLSLIPIALAGIIFGPLSGFLVGLLGGAVVLLAPSTSLYFALSPIGTILCCLLKTGIAGLVAGYLYIWISKKNTIVASIIASLSVPILNTGLFICFALIFFQKGFGELISIFISINFAIEFFTTILFAPIIAKVIQKYKSKKFNR